MELKPKPGIIKSYTSVTVDRTLRRRTSFRLTHKGVGKGDLPLAWLHIVREYIISKYQKKKKKLKIERIILLLIETVMSVTDKALFSVPQFQACRVLSREICNTRWKQWEVNLAIHSVRTLKAPRSPETDFPTKWTSHAIIMKSNFNVLSTWWSAWIVLLSMQCQIVAQLVCRVGGHALKWTALL